MKKYLLAAALAAFALPAQATVVFSASGSVPATSEAPGASFSISAHWADPASVGADPGDGLLDSFTFGDFTAIGGSTVEYLSGLGLPGVFIYGLGTDASGRQMTFQFYIIRTSETFDGFLSFFSTQAGFPSQNIWRDPSISESRIDAPLLAYIPPSVPEPASWLLMLGGAALTGTALRRRRPTVTFA